MSTQTICQIGPFRSLLMIPQQHFEHSSVCHFVVRGKARQGFARHWRRVCNRIVVVVLGNWFLSVAFFFLYCLYFVTCPVDHMSNLRPTSYVLGDKGPNRLLWLKYAQTDVRLLCNATLAYACLLTAGARTYYSVWDLISAISQSVSNRQFLGLTFWTSQRYYQCSLRIESLMYPRYIFRMVFFKWSVSVNCIMCLFF